MQEDLVSALRHQVIEAAIEEELDWGPDARPQVVTALQAQADALD
jgi:hypothetical protein